MTRSFLIVTLALAFFSFCLQAQQTPASSTQKTDETLMSQFFAMEGELVTVAFNAKTTSEGQKAITLFVNQVASEFSEKDLADGFPELLTKIVQRIYRDAKLVDSQEFLIEGFVHEKPRLDCDTTCYLVLFILEKMQESLPKQDLLSQLYFAITTDHMVCAVQTKGDYLYADLNVSLSQWEHLNFRLKPSYLEHRWYFPAEPLKPLPCREFGTLLLGNLGFSWLLMGKTDKALTTFETVLAKFPEHTIARRGMFRALYWKGEKTEALKYFEQHVDEIWSEKEYAMVCGLYAEQGKDIVRAIELAELAFFALEKNHTHVKKCKTCNVLRQDVLRNFALYAKNYAQTLRLQNQSLKAALFEQKAYFAEQMANQ